MNLHRPRHISDLRRANEALHQMRAVKGRRGILNPDFATVILIHHTGIAIARDGDEARHVAELKGCCFEG